MESAQNVQSSNVRIRIWTSSYLTVPSAVQGICVLWWLKCICTCIIKWCGWMVQGSDETGTYNVLMFRLMVWSQQVRQSSSEQLLRFRQVSAATETDSALKQWGSLSKSWLTVCITSCVLQTVINCSDNNSNTNNSYSRNSHICIVLRCHTLSFSNYIMTFRKVGRVSCFIAALA